MPPTFWRVWLQAADHGQDLLRVVLDGDRGVLEDAVVDAGFGEFLGLVGFAGVGTDGVGRVFELVAGEDAHDAVTEGDDALLAEQFRSGHARGWGLNQVRSGGRSSC